MCEELNDIFMRNKYEDTACKVRQLVSERSGNPSYVSGSEEDSQEFMMEILRILEAELQGNTEGTSILNKFWGTMIIVRKFQYSRYVIL